MAALICTASSAPPFRIGLNGVFIGNSTLSTAEQLALFQEVGVVGLRHIEPGDAGWPAVQGSNGLFNFTTADSVLASGLGFGFMPTFYGSGSLNYYVPPGTSSSNTWSAATYGTQTTTYLQMVVNRYKTTVKYWEIANEMNTKTTPPAGFSAADYAAFLVFNHDAIHAADPDAKVVIAGLLGNYGYPIENGYQWLRDVLAAGGGSGFDVFNYHDYKSWWTLPTHYDQYRAILDDNGLQAVPIWVSETAQASAILNANVNPAYASADGQAADVWRRPCLLFGKGAQTVFWHSFWDNDADTSGFRKMGLIDATTGIRKKAWHSFRLLTQKIEGFTTATLLSTGVTNDDNVTGGGGAWVVRFDFSDGSRCWVAWSPDNQTTSLDGLIDVSGVQLTTVVPASVSADGTTATWTTSTQSVNGGSVSLSLADAPVLIEVAPPPIISASPVGQTATVGASVTFTVAASGLTALSYQWQKGDIALPGETTGTLTLSSVVSSDAGDYTVVVTDLGGSTTSSAATLTINKASQTIAFPALADVTFTATPFTLSASASSGLPVSYTVVSGSATISGNMLTLTGSGAVTVRASQNGDANYLAAATVDRSFTVNSLGQKQTIKFSVSSSLAYGVAPFDLAATATSGLPVTLAVLSGPATLCANGKTLTITGAGTVMVQATQAGDGVYKAASAVERKIKVTPMKQSITFAPPASVAVGDSPTILDATASSGLPVTFSIVSGPATLGGDGHTFIPTGAGTVKVKASQAGNADVNAAKSVTKKIVISQTAS